MHLTDEQLNEYLDDETTERAQIELHLAECADCAARLAALQALFAEIESLPDINLSRPLAPHFTFRFDQARFKHSTSLPRWLTLTATLQAVVAIIIIVFTAPILRQFFTPILRTYSLPSLSDVVVALEVNLVMWIQAIQALQFPAIPAGIFILPEGFSTGLLAGGMIGIFLVWVVGNWWLLRKRPNRLV